MTLLIHRVAGKACNMGLLTAQNPFGVLKTTLFAALYYSFAAFFAFEDFAGFSAALSFGTRL
jgi:hypothetical protein